MCHYEIVFLVHPDQTPEQVLKIINYYKLFISQNNGSIHRLEDWGRRQLAYSINKLHKAYYILMNIELSKNIIIELKNKFSLDKMIIRHFVILLKSKVTSPSPMLNSKNDTTKSL